MVAEGEEGTGRCRGSSRATTQFYLTGSVVMLEPGTEARTRGERAARDGVFEALGLREGLVTMEMRDESESSVSPQINLAPLVKSGPTGSLRSLLRYQQCTSTTGADARWLFGLLGRSLALVCPPARALLRVGALCDGARRQVLTALVADTGSTLVTRVQLMDEWGNWIGSSRAPAWVPRWQVDTGCLFKQSHDSPRLKPVRVAQHGL